MSTLYCVYLTVYTGKKLPIFYIGSTSLAKINNGYRGSVASKEYGILWKEELKANPHLFTTKTISIHNSRKEAFEKEEKIQKILNVIHNPLYANKAFANSKFSLKQHTPWTREAFKKRIPWNKGKHEIYSEEAKSKMGRRAGYPGKKHTQASIEKMKGTNPKKALSGCLNGMYGKTHSIKVKLEQGKRASVRFKGKSYEELYGLEKATKLKANRSSEMKGKDNAFDKNPRFDPNEYSFYQLKTGTILTCTRWVFQRQTSLNKGGLSQMINHGIVYDGWCVLFT